MLQYDGALCTLLYFTSRMPTQLRRKPNDCRWRYRTYDTQTQVLLLRAAVEITIVMGGNSAGCSSGKNCASKTVLLLCDSSYFNYDMGVFRSSEGNVLLFHILKILVSNLDPGAGYLN